MVGRRAARKKADSDTDVYSACVSWYCVDVRAACPAVGSSLINCPEYLTLVNLQKAPHDAGAEREGGIYAKRPNNRRMLDATRKRKRKEGND